MKLARGFSLIEALVVMAILAILMGVAIPSLSTWISSTRLRLKAEGIISGISQARSQALKRNARIFFTLATDSSWTVGCVTAVTADRDGDGLPDCPAVIEQKVASEGGTGLTIAITPTGATTATYSGVGRLVANGDGTASLSQVDFSASNTAVVWSLVLSGTGQAKVCLNALNGTGDPYACS